MPGKASGWCKAQPVTGGPALRWLLWLGPNKVGRGYMDTGPVDPVTLQKDLDFVLLMGTYFGGRVMGPDDGFKIFSCSHDL